jgi:hypothetical protein
MKNEKRYAMKVLNYGNEEERSAADSEENVFKALKGCCEYLIDFVESFTIVLFYFIFISFFFY